MADEVLCTPAWLLVGMTRNVPGVLALVDGRVSFHTEDEVIFDAPLAELRDVTFPWYYFDGGLKLSIGGEQHRISLVRPNDAEDIADRLLARVGGAVGGAFALLIVDRKIRDIGTGRRAGKAWKEALTGSA